MTKTFSERTSVGAADLPPHLAAARRARLIAVSAKAEQRVLNV